MTKTAVILFNIGGPDRPEAVRPFLFNLFNDPAIICLPPPLRTFVAWMIARERAPIAQGIYAQIGGRSPILENTEAQAQILEQTLSVADEVKCFIAMRYWYPFVGQTVQDVKKYAPDKVVLLPLYPQFSTTTTASSLKSWRQTAKKAGLNVLTKTVCCYPEAAGFIGALAASTRVAYDKAKSFGAPRILFSAHGLPEKIVKAGDPYRWQCERTALALVKALAIPDLDWELCYQSRVGRLQWLKPSTDQEIIHAGNGKVPLVVVPIAFVSEHSETLVEIDIEYRHLAEKSGVPFYACVPTVSTAPIFIEGLAGLVRKALDSECDYISEKGGRICPKEFSGCCREQT